MRSSWRSVGGLVVAWALFVTAGCGGAQADPPGQPPPGSGSGTGGPDAGSPGGGNPGGGPDGGNPGGGPDGGQPDAGPPDAGPPDAGPGASITPPDLGTDWKFYATAEGLPPGNVMGVSADEAGNVYVAGGTAGLLVQRGGQGAFRKYGIADGLHPYGYLNGDAAVAYRVPAGSAADPAPDLGATPVISVAGGRAGTAFVGYAGKPHCEDAWKGDQWTPAAQWGDASVYKSGDADKVTLTADGVAVVHYDIFSGPGVVGDEPVGREKLCSIYRIVYQHGSNYVWFGGNHGFALGKADFAGNPTCNGQLGCTGVLEHSHPGFNDTGGNLVTGDYWGIAIDPLSQGGFHDVWFGGMARTTRFRFGEAGGDFWTAQPKTEDYTSGNINDPKNAAAKAAYQNRLDVWPDGVEEYDGAGNPTYPTPAQWSAGLDLVSGIAADPADGSVYIASFGRGIRHLDRSGNFIEDLTAKSGALFADNVSAIAIDTDGSLWVGYRYEGGISRLRRGSATQHYANLLGPLEKSPVFDIQLVPGTPRKVLVAFQSGAIGVYQGK